MAGIYDAKDAVAYLNQQNSADPKVLATILQGEDIDKLVAELAAHRRVIDTTYQNYAKLVTAMAQKMNSTVAIAEPIVRVSVQTAYDNMTPIIKRFNDVKIALQEELTFSMLDQLSPETAKNLAYVVYGDRKQYPLVLFPKRDDIAQTFRKHYGLEDLGVFPLIAVLIICAIMVVAGCVGVPIAINEWRRLKKQDVENALLANKQFVDKEMELHDDAQKVILQHYNEELAALKKEYPNGGAEYTAKLKALNDKHQTKSEEITNETRDRIEGYNKDTKDAMEKSGESFGKSLDKVTLIVVVGVGGLLALKGLSLLKR